MISRLMRVPALLTMVMSLLAGGLIALAPNAAAASTILCKGFAACEKAGMSTATYKQSYKTSYWRMYSGHNCTNYAAFRMIRNGLSATRPWSGSGNARNWGVALKSKVNATPMVGSIAWWQGGNHVAYVEQVVDANTIVVSEDHWGGDFDWRRITRTTKDWPNGFIHLADEAVKPTATPTISGTPQVGQPVTAALGSWNRTSPTLQTQWYANGAAIPGATATTYVPAESIVGKALSVRVTASKPGYVSGSATSAALATLPGTMTMTAPPRVSGEAKAGAVLTLDGGAWTPAQRTTKIQWQADGKDIAGATAQTYKVAPGLVGARIRAVVTAERPGYNSDQKSSDVTAPVLPDVMSVTAEPAVTGRARIGNRLQAVNAKTFPAAASIHYRWLRDGKPIRGATTRTYRPKRVDLGHTIGVRIAYERPGYRTLSRTAVVAEKVRAASRVRIRAIGNERVKVVVASKVTRRVHGTVTLTDGTGHSWTKELQKGRTAIFKSAALSRGKHRLTAEYTGSSHTAGATVVRTVVVR